VTRHGQPQPHVEVPPLRRSGGRASKPSESGTAAPISPQSGVVQIRVTRETWNPLVGAALATFGVTHKPPVLNHALQAAGSEPGRMGNFLTTLMNEMRVLGVTTLYTLQVPDIMGPSIRTPIGDLSSLAENLILLRFVELRSRLYRLVSVLKVRDSQFDPVLHEYATSSQGLVIDATSETAERIVTGSSPQEGAYLLRRSNRGKGAAASDGNRARDR